MGESEFLFRHSSSSLGAAHGAGSLYWSATRYTAKKDRRRTIRIRAWSAPLWCVSCASGDGWVMSEKDENCTFVLRSLRVAGHFFFDFFDFFGLMKGLAGE